MAPQIGLLVKGYPRLSETFIAQEIEAIEQAGIELMIISLRHPTDKLRHEAHDRIQAQILYLPEYLHHEPWRVLRGLAHLLVMPGAMRALRTWLRDLRRDLTPNRVRRFGQAAVLARELNANIELLYCHYIHTPSSVGRYTATIKGLRFAISAHAKDIWTSPEWEKREKLEDAQWAVTCTKKNHEHLSMLSSEDKVECLYHGINLTRFSDTKRTNQPDGSASEAPVRILSVARAVNKKGLDLLIDALARLPRSLNWRFAHIGAGALARELERRCEALDLQDRVVWLGARDQAYVLQAMRQANIFCLPARIAADGDQDGLPNVILEAMSQRMAVITTDVGAIGEVTIDGKNAIIVPPDDVVGLSQALEGLIRDPRQRRKLGEEARLDVVRGFGFGPGVARIIELLKRELASSASL